MTIGALDNVAEDVPSHRFNRRGWTFLTVAIVCEVAGSLSLRGALDQPGLYPVVALAYVCAFACLAQVLRTGFGIGMAYGIWTAAGVALTAIAGRVLFQERLTWVMTLGIALIIGGVLLIELGASH
ncbi:DMT family transporter [Citricoccus sp. NR2]|uniref:DMT family transporter n=1 Tax=Citricoccus sp. NR2 TaxID=3004095 RepID=UPI0022DE417A|nr:SMR family transporter [Citricoccus sp. NR2]WBL19976.1 SMR family transporter [Citricoccus sp. NR2]